MDSPLVSIIIPVYNSENHLEETILSALNQTWPNKELIIVDDGSTDGSLAIAKKYENSTVKVFSKINSGSGSTRNKGIIEAQGEFIQFLDADDLLSSDKIAKQMELLIPDPGKVAICSTVYFFDDEDPYKGASLPYHDGFLYDTNDPAAFLIDLYGGNNSIGSMIQTNVWLSPAAVIKKAGYWSEFYSPDDDGEFFCRVVLASTGTVFAKDCFNYYRKYRLGANLASAKTKQAINGKYRSFLLKKQYLLQATSNPLAKKALANAAMNLAVESFDSDKQLSDTILAEIKALGGTAYVPVIGGRPIELIKKLFGWKFAKKLQKIFSK
ncbi:glycosyltransferase family 2 protein [Mucilaginibacter sp. X5P1]|uniref:glycosyltransferase family 2 protein n=1 Tax=Mucilaginibacter sp. X5P1 TaxID=2723088 RepID=UPI0016127CD3|nr:glycosyltransferase family 2 protein [Mucilaginibacter sp. X5P1]MBB6141022.1 glycosyltransferase involved in cell wall biosynthesis [Mucilaginibacter sp. X5P1]